MSSPILPDWAFEAQELIEAEGEPPVCPACESGYGAFLGSLGSREHFRCVACGIDFSRERVA
jgi:transposase-like protein